MEIKLIELVQELDNITGRILANKETLEAMKTELGNIREDADNTNHANLTNMALRFRDIYHKLIILDDLFHFLMKDFSENFEELYGRKQAIFDKVVRQGESGHEKNPSYAPVEGRN